jgi:hypothetical protein
MIKKRCSKRLFQLFVLSILLAIAGTLVSLGWAERTCSDPVPPNCSTVRYLGEMDGCACFVCDIGTPREQTVCTRDYRNKEELLRKPRR